MAHLLVSRFYEELWNKQQFSVVSEILHSDITFRSSTGSKHHGINQVCDYVVMVTTALEGYTCTIQRCISTIDEAAAVVEFKGKHVGEFLNYSPTGKTISWLGAAFFSIRQNKISDIWVLSDLHDLHQQLSSKNDS